MVEITDNGSMIMIKKVQFKFYAELTLVGYSCDQSTTIEKSAGAQRVRLHGTQGVIVLRKGGKNRLAQD